MLQLRAGEFGGPHRSLYVRFDNASMCMYSPGGLPVERQLFSLFTPAGGSGLPAIPGNRLSIAPTPACSVNSKSPNTTGPEPVSIVMSSMITAPRPADV